MLGKALGIFNLMDSDNNVGSYFTLDDCSNILGVSIDDIRFLETKINDIAYIDQNELFKAWYRGDIPNAPSHRLNASNISCDELILAKIIENTYVNANVERQVKIGRYKMDLKVTIDNKSVFIEFDGPGHFAPARWGTPSNHPFKKKEIVEQATGIEVVNWAYWIQLCSSNVKALFEDDILGYGAIWSTKIHFGMFVFADSADIIKTINRRFNAGRQSGIGYFYEADNTRRIKPEHPIVQQIKSGKKDKGLLLPKGFDDERYWLPSSLH